MGLYKREYGKNKTPIWWVSYIDESGKRVRRSTGTLDRKEAEGLEAKWKLEAFQVKKWDKEPERTFDELMLAYLKATQGEKRSARRDRTSAKHLTKFYSGKPLIEFRPKLIVLYVNQRKEAGAQPATINREISLLSSAINYAQQKLDWEVVNPTRGQKLKEPEGRVRWLTAIEAQRLVSAAGTSPKAPYLSDFIQLALNTGCRKEEMLGLEWSRVDLQAGLIHLEARHTKSGKRRSIPINEKSRGAIISRAEFHAENCPSSPWVFALPSGERVLSIRRSFLTACRRAGITDFRVHDLRHTCAAWLVSAGAALAEVRDLLGHSTVKVTERYAHLAPENVRVAVGLLDNQSRFSHVTENEQEKRA
jgi:integrase